MAASAKSPEQQPEDKKKQALKNLLSAVRLANAFFSLIKSIWMFVQDLL